MSKVTITCEDDGEGYVKTAVDFDPPIETPNEATQAQMVGAAFLEWLATQGERKDG